MNTLLNLKFFSDEDLLSKTLMESIVTVSDEIGTEFLRTK
jgi:hypothetical protein